MSLIIGNHSIEKVAGFNIKQTYELIGGESILRAMSGRGIKQESYRRLKVVTSGMGWFPAGLDEIDTTVQHLVSCVMPRQVKAAFATRQATLPANRRSDSGYLPFGLAFMPNGQTFRVAVALAGNVATLGEVSGAVAYAAYYFPKFTAWVLRPTDSGDLGSANYSWEIICEEV